LHPAFPVEKSEFSLQVSQIPGSSNAIVTYLSLGLYLFLQANESFTKYLYIQIHYFYMVPMTVVYLKIIKLTIKLIILHVIRKNALKESITKQQVWEYVALYILPKR